MSDITGTCDSCGATEGDRLKNKPDEGQELRTCPFCNADKCCMCDMGDDVSCLSCEHAEDDYSDED